MSKDANKKQKKHAETAAKKAASQALQDAPVIREAWIAAIEAGAAAAIAVIRKASDTELVKAVATAASEEKSTKKARKPAEPAAEAPAV